MASAQWRKGCALRGKPAFSNGWSSGLCDERVRRIQARPAGQVDINDLHPQLQPANNKKARYRFSSRLFCPTRGFLVGPEWLEHSTYGLRVSCETALGGLQWRFTRDLPEFSPG